MGQRGFGFSELSAFCKDGCSWNRVSWFIWCYILVYYIILPPSTAPPLRLHPPLQSIQTQPIQSEFLTASERGQDKWGFRGSAVIYHYIYIYIYIYSCIIYIYIYTQLYIYIYICSCIFRRNRHMDKIDKFFVSSGIIPLLPAAGTCWRCASAPGLAGAAERYPGSGTVRQT